MIRLMRAAWPYIPATDELANGLLQDVGTKVLELGVGPGRYAALLQALGFETIGVDPIAYDSWEPLGRRGRMKFMSGIKAEALPFEDRTFDHVACMGALLYFEDPERALQEIRRVLKPGGHLVGAHE